MTKCCIVLQQGSGTNLLRAFLNSHPDIYFYDELFCQGRSFENILLDFLEIDYQKLSINNKGIRKDKLKMRY